MLSSKAIGAKVERILQDVENERWDVPTLATWINAGCRELVVLKPTALTAGVSMRLAAGTKQSLSGAAFKKTSDGSADSSLVPLQLLEVVRNMGADGITPGSAVVGIERRTLDVMLPGWHAVPAGGEIRMFLFDPKDPLTFWVYPQAPATALHAEVLVSRAPVNALADDAAALGTDDIDAGLSEIYEEALVDYVLYRCFSEDSEGPANAARAQGHYRAFASALGVKLKNEVGAAPRRPFDRAPAEGGQ